MSTSPVTRVLLWLLGTTSLATGIIGIFVPVLPTTPQVLLAGVCYLRSCESCHARLLQPRGFGPILRNWQTQRCTPAGARRIAIALIFVSFSTSLWLLREHAWPGLLLVPVGVGVITLLNRLRSCPEAVPESSCSASRQLSPCR